MTIVTAKTNNKTMNFNKSENYSLMNPKVYER